MVLGSLLARMLGARSCLPLLLVLLGAGPSGCRSWTNTSLDIAAVERWPDDDCRMLLDAARKDSWSASIHGEGSSDKYGIFAMAVSVEDTWVMSGEVEVTLYSTLTTASKRRIQEYRDVALRCGPDQQPLPHRTCRRGGRAYAIIDGRAIRRIPPRWNEYDCHVVGEVRVGRRWVDLSYPVELHPSLRRVVEGR